MLKVEYLTDYLQKEEFKSQQYVEQNSKTLLRRAKRAGDDLKLPEGFKVEKAIGGGDCFFDSFAKGLKQLKPDMDFTVKSLREVCKRFAQSQ